MRLTIITNFFPPDTGGASVIMFQLAKRLAAAGHQVQVLCPFPSYLRDEISEGYRGRLRTVETIEGIRVVRTWIYRTLKQRLPLAMHRWLWRISFPASAVLLGVWSLGRQDIVLFNSPPLYVVHAGLWIGRLTRARTVMYVGDMHPEAMLQLGYSVAERDLRRESRWARLGYKRSDLVLTTTQLTMEAIKKQVPQVAAAVLPHSADSDLFQPSLRSQSVRASVGAEAGDFLVGYFGLFGPEQGLDAVVDAAERVKGSGIRFVMAGIGPAKAALEKRARQLELDNIRFLDLLPRSEVAVTLASCDAALAPLVAAMPGTMPSKVFESLASGVPVVTSDGCDAADLVRDNDVGSVFKPNDGGDLARVLADLAARPQEHDRIRRNCLDLARRCDRDEAVARIEGFFRDLIGRR